MKRASHLAMAMAVIGLVIGLTATVTAISEETNDNATVSVTVASQTAVDVTPSDLNYNQVDPGARQEVSDGPDSDQFTGVEIENIGSLNLTHVWLNATVPTSNPFGSGISSEYDAGNFIMVNSTGEAGTGVVPADTHYSYVNRREYNESNDLSYIFTPTDMNWQYGRFRAGSQEFFWAVNVTDTGNCDTSGDDFRVGNLAHNESATGSNDFTDTNEYTSYDLTDLTSGPYLAPSVSLDMPSQPDRDYDVLVSCSDPTYTVRTEYNPTAEGSSDLTIDGTVAQHLVNSTATSPDAMQPGDHFSLDMAVEVPQGVADGSVESGLLRVFAASN